MPQLAENRAAGSEPARLPASRTFFSVTALAVLDAGNVFMPDPCVFESEPATLFAMVTKFNWTLPLE